MARELVVLGVDPGSRAHGWAVLLVSPDGSARFHSAGHWEGPAAELVLNHGSPGPKGEHRPRPYTCGLDLVAVETPVIVHSVKAIIHLLRTAQSAGAALGAATAMGRQVQGLSPVQWRREVVGVGSPKDDQVKEAIEREVANWPKRSNAHMRDAAGVALAGARALLRAEAAA